MPSKNVTPITDTKLYGEIKCQISGLILIEIIHTGAIADIVYTAITVQEHNAVEIP